VSIDVERERERKRSIYVDRVTVHIIKHYIFFSSLENNLHSLLLKIIYIVMIDKFVGLELSTKNSQRMYILLENERHEEREHFLET
jgi:hypothetical protein